MQMDNELCKIHNEPALLIQQDAKHNQVIICKFCEQQSNISNQDDVYNEEQEELKQLEVQFDQNIKLIKDFAEILEQFTQQIQQKLKEFKQQVEISISQINEMKNESNHFSNLQLNQINEQKNIINNLFSQTILQIKNKIKEIENCTKLDELYQQLQNINIEGKYKLESFVIDKQFDYQLMQQSSYKQSKWCCAIAFNKDASIMIAGNRQLIRVFEFKNDKLKELQQLSGHSDKVFCLQFMKKSNQFISASHDSTIIIWGLDSNYLYSSKQVLKDHKNMIQCITMNKNEDMLISGSFDATIKFWKNQHNFWSCNQSIDCQSQVQSVSLNSQEDNLIASLTNNQISVIQFLDNLWMIKQKITVEQDGFRLCYINQNQFLFQPRLGQHLQIFDYNTKDQTYIKGQVLQYSNIKPGDDALFPIQYVSQIGLVIVKNGHHLHLIKRNQTGLLTIEQSINFSTFFFYGCITDDGRYIATWDDKSKEIQLRKFEF